MAHPTRPSCPRRAAPLAVATLVALVAAGCDQAAQVQRGLTGAYDSAVNQGKHLRLPKGGDVGLDKLSSTAVHDELGKITALVPSGADTKSVLGTACDAKSRYETGTAKTYDEAAAAALKAHGVDVSTAVIARIEQHLVHAAESSNPVPAAAAVFACRWAGAG